MSVCTCEEANCCDAEFGSIFLHNHRVYGYSEDLLFVPGLEPWYILTCKSADGISPKIIGREGKNSKDI